MKLKNVSWAFFKMIEKESKVVGSAYVIIDRRPSVSTKSRGVKSSPPAVHEKAIQPVELGL